MASMTHSPRRYIRPNWNFLVVRGSDDFQYCVSRKRESNCGAHHLDGDARSNSSGQHEFEREPRRAVVAVDGAWNEPQRETCHINHSTTDISK